MDKKGKEEDEEAEDEDENDDDAKEKKLKPQKKQKDEEKTKKATRKKRDEEGEGEEEHEEDESEEEKDKPEKGKAVKFKQRKEEEEDGEEEEEEEEEEDGEEEEEEDEEEVEEEARDEDEAGFRRGRSEDQADEQADEQEDEQKDEQEDEQEDGQEEQEEQEDEQVDAQDDEPAGDDDIVVDLSATTSKYFTRKYWELPKKVLQEDLETKVVRERKQGKKKTPEEEEKERELKEKERKKKEEEKKKKEEVEYTPEMVNKKLLEILSMRGKKGADRHQMIDDLKTLAIKATAPATLLKVNTTLCSTLIDTNLNKGAFMTKSVWKQAHEVLNRILMILQQNPGVRLSEDEQVEESFDDFGNEDKKRIQDFVTSFESAEIQRKREERKELEKASRARLEDGTEIQYINGNLFSFIRQMTIEFRKALQHIDPHSQDYVIRLRDEPGLIDLIVKTKDYYGRIEKKGFPLQSGLDSFGTYLLSLSLVPRCPIFRDQSKREGAKRRRREKKKSKGRSGRREKRNGKEKRRKTRRERSQ